MKSYYVFNGDGSPLGDCDYEMEVDAYDVEDAALVAVREHDSSGEMAENGETMKITVVDEYGDDFIVTVKGEMLEDGLSFYYVIE